MKKKIVLLLSLATMSILLIACSDASVDSGGGVEKQQDSEIFIEPEQEEEKVVVSDLLTCPQFTAEPETAFRVNQISLTAKEHAANLTEDQTAQIISIIREADHNFYNGSEEMEKFMWYGFLLDYKYNDSDPRSQLGTDLCQAIKYVYSNVESVLDDSTHKNLLQIDKTLETIH